MEVPAEPVSAEEWDQELMEQGTLLVYEAYGMSPLDDGLHRTVEELLSHDFDYFWDCVSLVFCRLNIENRPLHELDGFEQEDVQPPEGGWVRETELNYIVEFLGDVNEYADVQVAAAQAAQDVVQD